MAERLQKVMAAAGLGSRRACEEMILDGRVLVDGQPVTALPVLVEPSAKIQVDGKPIRRERLAYYLLHKPRGVLCTTADPDGRTAAVDLLPGIKERVFSVGRLDAESSGLLLFTNDGELSNRLTHPRYEIAKVYEAEVVGALSGEDIEKLLAGIYLSEGRARADRIRVVGRSRQATRVAITLTESRNRQIRRVLARLGHKVRRLCRVSMGKLTLRGLGPGSFRPLADEEVRYLRRLAGLEVAPRPGGAAAKPARPSQVGGLNRRQAAAGWPVSGASAVEKDEPWA